MFAWRYIGSSSSKNWIAPITSPSTSITREPASATNSSISPGGRWLHQRRTSGSVRIGARRPASSAVVGRSVTRGPERITAPTVPGDSGGVAGRLRGPDPGAPEHEHDGEQDQQEAESRDQEHD